MWISLVIRWGRDTNNTSPIWCATQSIPTLNHPRSPLGATPYSSSLTSAITSLSHQIGYRLISLGTIHIFWHHLQQSNPFYASQVPKRSTQIIIEWWFECRSYLWINITRPQRYDLVLGVSQQMYLSKRNYTSVLPSFSL